MAEFKRKAGGEVVLPVLKVQDNVTLFVKVESEIVKTEGRDFFASEPDKMKINNTIRVLNLQDNKKYMMYLKNKLANALLNLGTYVGKSFEIKQTPASGKSRAKGFEIFEIEA